MIGGDGLSTVERHFNRFRSEVVIMVSVGCVPGHNDLVFGFMMFLVTLNSSPVDGATGTAFFRDPSEETVLHL
jgi:hypothetical protein